MKVSKAVEMYDFTPEEIKHFNGTSGIYALIHNNEVFYVGQSKNIGNRLREHRKEGAFDTILKKIIKEEGKCNRCKSLAMYDFINKHREEISFVVLKETTERDKYEKHYIELFLPRYNYKGVDVPFS